MKIYAVVQIVPEDGLLLSLREEKKVVKLFREEKDACIEAQMLIQTIDPYSGTKFLVEAMTVH